MLRLLIGAFKLGRGSALHGEAAQIVSLADGDLLIFHVPQNVYDDKPFRNDVREVMGSTLKGIGARAIILPESMKLTYLLKAPQGDADTEKG
jgi:hypothetical protein